MAKRYTVVYMQDAASGFWIASIDSSQGVSCTTQGATRDEARVRIREALAVYLDDNQAAAAAELVEEG
jgi:predicted RNase H-like HicB family nuclease